VTGILHICMANRCRSALAELITCEQLASRGLAAAFPVASAGTWTRGGEPIWPAAGAEARRRGLDPDRFRSRQVTPALVREADLVLAATRALRDEVVAQAPFALRRTFTWRELAWLLDGVAPDDVPGQTPLERLQAIPAIAAARRGHLVPPPGDQVDVEDPVGLPPAHLPIATDQIHAAVTVLVDVLAGQGHTAR
jgi:protein-tyrosine phosphatase